MTYSHSKRRNKQRRVIRGRWDFEHKTISSAWFEWKELSKDGFFNGSFSYKTSSVPERGVKLAFTPRDETEEVFDVKGSGSNELFGEFTLKGTAKQVSGEKAMYAVSIRKEYVGTAPAQATALPADGGDAADDNAKSEE